ncbi:MAG TPA: LuxR C-terminal-related transcriptional regulator [Rhizomicrobium sp.]
MAKRAAAEKGAVANLVQEYLRADSTARLFLDRDFRILWMNDSAKGLLTQQSVLKAKAGRLGVSGRSNQAYFRKLLDSASAGDRVCLVCEETKQHVLVSFVSLIEQNYFALSVRIARDLPLTVGILTTAFGLTAKESALVLGMFQGFTAEEIAKRMDVSIDTTRTHIRNIYGKLAVNSREAMIHRLLPYVTG